MGSGVMESLYWIGWAADSWGSSWGENVEVEERPGGGEVLPRKRVKLRPIIPIKMRPAWRPAPVFNIPKDDELHITPDLIANGIALQLRNQRRRNEAEYIALRRL